jgi:F-type H+-transporting ATPase subunit c
MDGLITSGLLALTAPGDTGWAVFGAAITCGVIIIGASYGLSTIAGKAVEAIARQPEAGGRIFLTTVIAAAMVEGFTFFALLICFMTVFWMRGT